MVAAFDAQKNDMVIDYEHQTLAGTEAPAAGWIKELINKGKDGVWAVVEWTEKAKEYLKNKEYRYLSPVFLKRASDNKVVKLINAGLTNQPAIDGMMPLINKMQVASYKMQEEQKTKKEVIQMKRLLEVLGLDEDATEDAAIEAVKKLMAQPQVVANKTVLESLGLKDGSTESEIVGTIMAMKQSHSQTGDLAAKVKELSDRLAARDADELVACAMKEGKLTAAQKPWADEYAKRDPEGFKVFVAKASVVVPVGDMPKGGDKKAGGLDDTTLLVAKMFGNKEEDVRKTMGN